MVPTQEDVLLAKTADKRNVKNINRDILVQIRVLQNYEKQMLVLDSFVTFIDKDLVEDITVGPGFFKSQVLMVKFV